MSLSYTGNVVTITGDYHVQFRDRVVYADTTGGGYKAHLPRRPFVGERHTFKDYVLHFNIAALFVVGDGPLVEDIQSPAFVTSVKVGQRAACATWEFSADGQWHLIEFYPA